MCSVCNHSVQVVKEAANTYRKSLLVNVEVGAMDVPKSQILVLTASTIAAREILGVWTKVPFLQCPLYIKNGVFVFKGLGPRSPFSLFPCKEIEMRSLDLRRNHASKPPTLFLPFMNLQNRSQRPHLF